MSKEVSASETRIIRFLKQGICEVQDSVRESHVLLVGEQGTIAAARAQIDAMHDKELIRFDGQHIALAQPGRKNATRKAARPQSAARITQNIELEPGRKAEVNLSESPLAMLYRRKGPDGTAFLSEDEFRAGERLRADFTRGSLMPSVTSRWDVGVGGNGHSGAGGIAELTDIALASRVRFERALAAVGPELSGVLIDICCFLKGLERVERERQWPVRSAKMLLKAGLAMLHRHYNPQQEKVPRPDAILHWGAHDYRPSIQREKRG